MFTGSWWAKEAVLTSTRQSSIAFTIKPSFGDVKIPHHLIMVRYFYEMVVDLFQDQPCAFDAGT